MKFRIIASIVVVVVLVIAAIIIGAARNTPDLDADGQPISVEQY
jgi:hypothetical protein